MWYQHFRIYCSISNQWIKYYTSIVSSKINQNNKNYFDLMQVIPERNQIDKYYLADTIIISELLNIINGVILEKLMLYNVSQRITYDELDDIIIIEFFILDVKNIKNCDIFFVVYHEQNNNQTRILAIAPERMNLLYIDHQDIIPEMIDSLNNYRLNKIQISRNLDNNLRNKNFDLFI